MRAIFALIVVAAFAATAPAIGAAGTERITIPAGGAIVVPPTSPAHGGKDGKDGVVHFAGKFEVTGTFVIDYRDGPTSPEFSFAPDAGIAARLPHADGEARIGNLNFDDNQSDAVIAAIVPAATLADVKAHAAKQASVHVTLEVDTYAAAIDECTGDGWYTAHFVSVHKPGTVRIGKTPPREEPQDC